MGKNVEKSAEKEKEERLKLEIARELGVLDRVLEDGWGALSAKETGRIGGIMGKRKKAMKQDQTAGS